MAVPLAALAAVSPAVAQSEIREINGRKFRQVNGRLVPMSGKPAEASRNPSKPGGGEKKPDGNKDGEEKADEKEKDGPAAKVIRREALGDAEGDPKELKATVGEDGRVAFQFRNQPWVALVQWLSDISEQPLDWQELPSDRVNLTSPGRYTVEQTRDLFNRHLLARGYTLLEVDGGLTVVKTKNINPALVRRVEANELDEIPPYTFVRTLLDVGWLSAEKLAEELGPMISSNGRLTALTTTNRLEAMDAAVNLRQVARLLEEERDNASRDALAPEFELRHIPAEEAKTLLEQFLGVEKKQPAPMTPQQIQMMQRMAQQNKNKGAPEKPKEEISIVANVRRNSILIRAPKDRIAVATEFIKRIDVPSDSMVSLADVESRFQVFRLASLDPEQLIEIVGEMNVLEPGTRIRADKENGAVMVFGSAADRFIINSLIERLDGSGRSFEVLQLRRLDASEVAESISFLMGQEEKEDDSSSRRRYYYSPFSNDEDEESQSDEFRVAANARYNQVLLWASESEMEEVRNLLIKLGELPPPGGRKDTFRMIDASTTPETYQYLLRLQKQWQSISGQTLEIPTADAFSDPIAEIKAGRDAAAQAELQGTGSLDSNEVDTSSGTGASSDGESSLNGETSSGSGGSSSGQPEAAEPGEPETTEDDSDDLAASQRDAGSFYRFTATGQGDAGDSGEAGDSSGGGSRSASNPGDAGVTDDPASDGAAGEGADDEPIPEIRSAEEFDRLFGTRRSRPSDGADGGDASGGDAEKSDASSPIRITINAQGNLVLSGSDTRALDRLENLMMQVQPPRRPYHVFKIKDATASWVTINLEEYFADLEDDDTSDDSFGRWYFGHDDEQEDEGPGGLGRTNELRFVWDNDTNTIVVSGATTDQLRTIAELIELWDVPQPVDQKRVRYTRIVPIRYSRAERIAETVKDAYRDLLSSKDKAFTGGRGGQPGRGGGGGRQDVQRNRNGDGSGLTDQESGREAGGSDFNFAGKLSIGVDEVGNTLVVSAEGEALLELVVGVIEQLDEAAMPSGDVNVVQVSGSLNGDSLLEALEAFGVRSAQKAESETGRPGGREPRARPGREFRGGADGD